MKNKKISKILCNVLAILVGIVNLASIITTENASAINSFLGVSTQKIVKTGSSEAVDYYTTKYSSVDELRAASIAINEEVMAEGMVLLKNDNDALPLSKGDSVSLYSANSVTLVYTGSGSSSSLPEKVNKHAVNLKDGLTASGLDVNTDLWNWYMQNTQYWQGEVKTVDGKTISTISGNRNQSAKFYTKDAPFDKLPDSASQPSDAAILVVSRNGGENADLYRNKTFSTMSSGNYLELGDNEKDVLKNLKTLKDNGVIKKIVVLMNSANQVQCDFADNPEYGVDALLWVGSVGSTGANSIGKVLVGDVNPSGRLSDTFWYSHDQNPVYANFGAYDYANSGVLHDDLRENRKYVVYQEGIYNGYRYTETRYTDYVTGAENAGLFDYATTVSYPFGYGLSYTTFDYKLESVTPFVDSDNSTTYNVTVKVTNTGSVAGKEVAQVYLQKPYTDYDKANGIEKAAVELVGYAKTDVLQPGASKTVTVSVQERYFASYDYTNAKTYVIGSEQKSDKYYLTVAKNAHDAVNNVLAAQGFSTSAYQMDADGNAALTYETHIDFDSVKYSTNKNIKAANANFEAKYEGQLANYGVSSITNRFSDVDFQLYEGFSDAERSQPYVSRSNWQGTLGVKIDLTASSVLKDDQATPIPQSDSVAYPTFGETNGLTLADLRAFEDGTLIDYDNPLWDKLLDQITWEEMCDFLSDGLRQTGAIESINAPKTLQFNGAVGPVPGDAENNSKYKFNTTEAPFQGFVDGTDGEDDYPVFFCCNGIVASTFNNELVKRLGEQIGEECLWVGMSGIYGLGVNLHRGAYCGRNFEYYSEDGYLAGVACAYELSGIQSQGVFVIMKHALLNDQEDSRHGIGSWANEQTIRELYLLPTEIAVNLGDDAKMAGIMTGLNRMGAKWCSAQGFCSTVLRGELGMNGFIISDFYSKKYMNPIAGVMYGNDLPDGTVLADTKTADGVTNNFDEYSVGYGELAWKMRESAHRILYTIVRSSAMNRMTSDTKVIKVTPAWQTALTAACITIDALFALSVAYVVLAHVYKGKKVLQTK